MKEFFIQNAQSLSLPTSLAPYIPSPPTFLTPSLMHLTMQARGRPGAGPGECSWSGARNHFIRPHSSQSLRTRVQSAYGSSRNVQKGPEICANISGRLAHQLKASFSVGIFSGPIWPPRGAKTIHSEDAFAAVEGKAMQHTNHFCIPKYWFVRVLPTVHCVASWGGGATRPLLPQVAFTAGKGRCPLCRSATVPTPSHGVLPARIPCCSDHASRRNLELPSPPSDTPAAASPFACSPPTRPGIWSPATALATALALIGVQQ